MMTSHPNISPFSGEASILAERALKLPLYTKLTGKRLVLASSSPRRLKILRDIVRLELDQFDYLVCAADMNVC
jgi:hypothetical protein